MLIQNNLSLYQPSILKLSQPFHNGIQPQNTTRHSLGFVLHGRKNIYYGDVCHEVNQGDIFYLGTGMHYIEDLPDKDREFEQIVFYYTPERLSSILSRLSQAYDMEILNDHACERCHSTSHVVCPSWSSVKNFFFSINQYIKDGIFNHDHATEAIKMTELIYLIVSHDNSCLKHKVLTNVDTAKEQFEQIINNHIFTDISIDELSQKCNRSLTSFKKEFKKHFFTPPHKWFLKQRLMHSRLLLISTEKSVSEVGVDCNFPNTSHFIKLFKKEYNMTPSAYRHSQEKDWKTSSISSLAKDCAVEQCYGN